MSPRAQAHRRSGLTLIELAISAALFALAAVAFLGAFQTSINLDQLNRERFWAREECRRQLETIMALDYSKVAALDNTTFDVGFDVNGVTGAEKLLKGPTGTKVGLIRVDTTVAGDAVCCKVTVSATWRSGQRKDAVSGAITDETTTVTLVGNVSLH